MKRTKILAAVAGLSLFSTLLLGCGDPAIGKLQTIKLTAVAAQSAGTVELKGEGGVLQLNALGIYSHSQVDLTQKVTYNVTITPNSTDYQGFPLLAPPQTMTLNTSGLATAVPPFVCTFTNLGTTTTPSWFLTGSYQITATFGGVTSQPIFIAIASAAGNGPNGACGP